MLKVLLTIVLIIIREGGGDCFLWYVYIIEVVGVGKWNLNDRRYYVGETTDIERRWHEHVGMYHSFWMKRNKWRPSRLVHVECLPDCYSKDIAMLREQQLKRLSKDDKRGFAE
jgi:predicted GIY-YIG superfamily endonuclease